MLIKYATNHFLTPFPTCVAVDTDWMIRVRTLTGKEIELDIESDYKVRRT